MKKLFEITLLSPITQKIEKRCVWAVTLLDVERIKSSLVLQGYTAMCSREVQP